MVDSNGNDVAFTARNWATYWGGMGAALGNPMIHAKVRELRLAVGSLAAKKQDGGPRFAIKSAKELFQKVSQAASDLNLVVYVIGQKFEHIPTESGTACWVQSTVRVAAEDGSYIDGVGIGHGMDRDDKAFGKASTYSTKDALLKLLMLPEKDLVDTDDEEGVGADVKPGKRAAKRDDGPTEVQAPADRIQAAKTEEELRALLPWLKSLPEADQGVLGPIFKERMGQVKAAQS